MSKFKSPCRCKQENLPHFIRNVIWDTKGNHVGELVECIVCQYRKLNVFEDGAFWAKVISNQKPTRFSAVSVVKKDDKKAESTSSVPLRHYQCRDE